MRRTFCDNCNEECRPRTVTISWSADADPYPQTEHHGLCETCARCLATLDFAEFAVRHDTRPRTTELP